MGRKKGKKSGKKKEERVGIQPENRAKKSVSDDAATSDNEELFHVQKHCQVTQDSNGECIDQQHRKQRKKKHLHQLQLEESPNDGIRTTDYDFNEGKHEADYRPGMFPLEQHVYVAERQQAVGVYPPLPQAFQPWGQRRVLSETLPPGMSDYRAGELRPQHYALMTQQQPLAAQQLPIYGFPTWRQVVGPTDTSGIDDTALVPVSRILIPQQPYVIHHLCPQEFSAREQRTADYGSGVLTPYQDIAQQQTLEIQQLPTRYFSALEKGPESMLPRINDHGYKQLVLQHQPSLGVYPILIQRQENLQSLPEMKELGSSSLPQEDFVSPGMTESDISQSLSSVPMYDAVEEINSNSCMMQDQPEMVQNQPETQDYEQEQSILHQSSTEDFPALVARKEISQMSHQTREFRRSSLPQEKLLSIRNTSLSELSQGVRPLPTNEDMEEIVTSDSYNTVHEQLLIQGTDSDIPAAVATKEISPLKTPSRRNKKNCESNQRKIIVETNYLALDLSKIRNNIVIHYDVVIEPLGPKRLLRTAMEIFREKYYPQRYPAFDGKKNLYSSGFLPFGEELFGEIAVHDEETCTEKLYNITVKYASQVDLQSLIKYMANRNANLPPQDVIQAIDIVLRNAAPFSFVPVGRCFFTPPKNKILELGGGLEMWYGFFQSAIMGWKPFINIDVVHKGFPRSINVVDIILDVCNNIKPEDLHRELSVWHKTDFISYIRGLKIDYMLPDNPTSKRTYKVNNIAESAAEQRFELDDGRYVTVQEYFTCEKKLKLKYPNLPCLNLGAPNRTRPIYVPVELCTISKGQVSIKKINEKQATKLIKQAATNTEDRKRKILETLKQVGFQNDPCVREFGLSVNDRFEKVEARVLEAPQLEYKPISNKRNLVQPVKGTWKATLLMSCNKLSSWIILDLDQKIEEEDLRYFVKELQFRGKNLGMEIAQPLNIHGMHLEARNVHKLETFFTSMKNKVQLVLVVVPDKSDFYAKVKRMAELNVGVLTQCVKARTVLRMKGSTCSNIILKLNSKLNGVNHTLAPVSRPPCLRRPVMIVGADVTHPSQDQTDIPSVAAVSASHDPKAFQYNVQIRLQTPKIEIIEDLEAIMKQQLLFFYKKTSYKPERIIFFRDGVSEGQFPQVLNNEVKAIRSACSSLSQEYKPKVTFLVVQKRHHTRFFPSPEDAEGDNHNVPPGTVVDTDITHPTEVDFFLVSHASIQGVSRPTKYRLLWNDDENLTEDEIEQITYYLCHMFSRCTRSVSYPAPTYYAHLAAYRARVYLEGEKIRLNDLPMEQKKCAVQKEIIIDHPMFFV